LLIKDILSKLEEVVIDIEFEGKENVIKDILMNYIRKTHPKFSKRNILFRRIGKKSDAHKVAVTVFRDKRAEDRIIRREEIEELL
jgi:hypothetical protein